MAVDSALPSSRPLFLAEQPVGPDGRPVLRRIFIANRGEIACRVIATCRKLGLTSIAVYVDEDSSSLHVRQADESIRLGSITQAGTNPFLDAELLVATAVGCGAHAVHPGYGYLSEDADFARAVRAAGLVFVGPSAAALSTLGNKRAAKAYLSAHAPDVPLIPGFAGDSQHAADLEAAAASIGYPVMLKAAAGGGGKGMRVVRAADELGEALERARSEAGRSFGSADCILEKFVEAAKHVELQVVGDGGGVVVCLGERDCSVQRRHQKVVEETPCAWLSEELRTAMAAAAIRVAALIGYEGAGTVEFVVDVAAARFYFLEVNARLQVEHPITEEATSVDLVALQLFVAAGGRLANVAALQPVVTKGHAIECRLCAEDPHRDFLPERGTVRLWNPARAADTRFETAVETGAEVSIHFDPLLAKLVVWAPTRARAIEAMSRALAHTACVGVRTNQLFLQRCLAHPAFRDPAYTTAFIPTHLPALLQSPSTEEASAALLPALPCLYLDHLRAAVPRPFRHVRRAFRNQPHDPVNRPARIVHLDAGGAEQPLLCAIDPAVGRVRLVPVPSAGDPSPTARHNALSTALRRGLLAATPSHAASLRSVEPLPAAAGWRAASVCAVLGGRVEGAQIVAAAEEEDGRGARRVEAHVAGLGTWVGFGVEGVLGFGGRGGGAEKGEREGGRVVRAPMPCRVLRVERGEGVAVRVGEGVVVVESMKMEMRIVAGVDGVVRVRVREGEAVGEGEVLFVVE
ncbi:hypothetical protein GTA08_BOTSDO13224 [Neofusicoccum parvum]|uniref:Uncharacterized protein n=1 Tax=Neofusicoccum parvum TaxID=310453 RepID=A0ACB5SL71_9PEZI|nr:hypothetical protein GTA08_BOTSDO13224 [Neofusicoccum parvum]